MRGFRDMTTKRPKIKRTKIKGAKIRFLDPGDIKEAIAELAVISERAGMETALVGGIAMSVYGSDRLTKDVDVACRTGMLPGMRKLKELSFGGISARSPSGHPVDIIVRSDAYRDLYDDAILNALDEGLALPVVSPEYLAALKMAAARDKDMLDLETLVRLKVLDLKKTRSIIGRYLGEYAAREWDSLISEFEWKSSREE
jgi:hypothetical protein